MHVAIAGEVHRVKSLRNPLQKMSKSDNQELSCVNLSDPPDLLVKKIKRAVTDFEGRVTYEPETRPGVSNLVTIYAAMSGLTHQQVCQEFAGKQTAEFKLSLGDLLVEKLTPIRQELSRLEADPGYVDSVLQEGAEKARKLAQENLATIKQQMGLC